ncbi:MAG: hypothetical protein J5528_03990, partial [Firmicutes bacterium]|nr:hypothetical protein [Bacillota bacterium]
MERKEKLEVLRSFKYTHRGYHDKPHIPENSMAAFMRTKERGWGSEMDIRLMKDGNLGISHDSNLKRVTGFDVHIEDLTKEDLGKYYLEESEEHVPLFEDLLELRIPLIVELKVENGNYKELSEAAWERLKDYDAPYCIESFDPRVVLWFKKNHPEVIRGQLAQDYSKEAQVHVSGLMKTMLRDLWFNPIIKPDFVAYRFSDRQNKYLRRYVRKGGQEVSWTIRTKEDYDTAVKDGSIPI